MGPQTKGEQLIDILLELIDLLCRRRELTRSEGDVFVTKLKELKAKPEAKNENSSH